MPALTRFDGLPADAPPRAIRPRPRILSNPFLRLLLFAVALIAVGLTTSVAVQAAGVRPTPLHPINALTSIFAACVAYAVVIFPIEARRHPVEVRLDRLGGLVVGLGAGALLFVLCFVGISAVGGFHILGVGAPRWGEWWLTLLAVGAGAGIAEEIIFRGIAYRIVEELLGTWGATVISGVLFGAAHLTNPDATTAGAIGIGVAGMMFGLLYATSRSLWFVMGFHAAWNVVQGPVLGVIVSGTGEANGFLRVTPRGSDLVSGGIFGAEASIVTVVVLALATAYLAVRIVRRREAVAPMWTRRSRQRTALATGVRPDAASLDAKQRRRLQSLAVEPVRQEDAALDGQGHPGDPGGLVGGQEQQRIGDV